MTKKSPKYDGADPEVGLPLGMQKTQELPKRRNPNEVVDQEGTDRWGDLEEADRENAPGAFTPLEMGQPDADIPTVQRNRNERRSAGGPLQEEGEGDRQNSQLAELEGIPPSLSLDDPSK